MGKEGKRDPVNHRTPAQKREDQRKRRQTEKEKKAGVLRKKARRAMERAGKVKKGDGKDVHHKKPIAKGGTSTPGNLSVKARHANRSVTKRSPSNKK